MTDHVSHFPPVSLIPQLLQLVPRECSVGVLSNHHYGRLQGVGRPEDTDDCALFELRSPAFTHPAVCSQLPVPATLDSVPAAGRNKIHFGIN